MRRKNGERDELQSKGERETILVREEKDTTPHKGERERELTLTGAPQCAC